jgi:hypothetical protein
MSVAGFSLSEIDRITISNCSEFLDRILILDFPSPQFHGACISFLDFDPFSRLISLLTDSLLHPDRLPPPIAQCRLLASRLGTISCGPHFLWISLTACIFSRDLLDGRMPLFRVLSASSLSAFGIECAAIGDLLCRAFTVPNYVPYVFGLETHTFSAFDSLIKSILAK